MQYKWFSILLNTIIETTFTVYWKKCTSFLQLFLRTPKAVLITGVIKLWIFSRHKILLHLKNHIKLIWSWTNIKNHCFPNYRQHILLKFRDKFSEWKSWIKFALHCEFKFNRLVKNACLIIVSFFNVGAPKRFIPCHYISFCNISYM